MVKTIFAVLLAAAPACAADFGLNAMTTAEAASLPPAAPAVAAPAEAPAARSAQWRKVALTVTLDQDSQAYHGAGEGMTFSLARDPKNSGGLAFRFDFAGGGAESGIIKNGVVSDAAGNRIDLSRDPFEYPALLGGKPHTLLGNCTYDQGFIDTLQEAPYENSGLALNRKVKADATVRITGSYDAARFSRAEIALILAAYVVME